jgi:hypothetical protein
MKDKLSQLKLKSIRFIAQTIANIICKQMQLCIDVEDKAGFYMLYERAAVLNSYCVIFHDIYLD